ncbi:MAG: transporter substrate-binding domain-containing protein [Desulfobacula sp.]|jgi:polar amino acid transport system substrate-binding protein
MKKRNSTMKQIIIFFILFLAGTAMAQAEQTIFLATADGPPLSKPDNTGFHDKIILEIFLRIGIRAQILHLPAERALINADSGIEEGVFVRVAGMEKLYPNLVHVPEKITDYEFTAFTKHPNMVINGWESLKPYSVGIITGWKILENNIRDTKELLKVETPEQLFGVLDTDRVDLIIYNRYDGYGVLKQLNLKHIRLIEPPLASREMFLYLNTKRKNLVVPLTEALRAIKQDGTYQRLFTEIIHPLIPN